MLKTSSNIQKGSDILRNLSKNAAKAHSVFVGLDSVANHVSHNKAFHQTTRDHAKNARYVTEMLKNLTGSAKQSQQRFTPVPRTNIPTHIRVPSNPNPSDDEVLRAIQHNWNQSQRV